MVTNTDVLAIIPAYSSSEAGNQQYLRPVGAHPLLAYSVAAAVKAENVNRTLVATGSEAVAESAQKYGAEVPFLYPLRPAANSTDDWALLRYVLDQLADKQSYRPELVAWMHPFTPFRPPGLVDQAIGMLLGDPQAQSIHAVVPADAAVISTWKINARGTVNSQSGQVTQVDSAGAAPGEQLYLQTRHLSVIRIASSRHGSLSDGQVNRPVIIDPRYAIDVSTPFGWEWADWVIRHARLDLIYPGKQLRRLPEHVNLLVLDFDGVMTDNRVWVSDSGHEQVVADRGDSLGLNRLRQSGVDVCVLSTETNPVVAQRCKKLNLPFIQGVSDKAVTLVSLLSERHANPSQVVYLGNDVNDLPCFPLVGYAVATADAHHNAILQADLVLSRNGGNGAIRELCDLLLRED